MRDAMVLVLAGVVGFLSIYLPIRSDNKMVAKVDAKTREESVPEKWETVPAFGGHQVER